MGQMRNDIKEGINVSYRDLQDIRTSLADMAESAARTGDAPTARIAGSMKRDLDDYLEYSSQNPALRGSMPEALPGSKSYKQANQYAREVTGNDPYYEDLKYLMENGINRDAALQVIGVEGVRDLNRVAPGLIRTSGKLHPDTIGDSLSGGPAYGYGGETPSGQALLDTLIDRIGPGRGRIRADEARLRGEYLAGNTSGHTGFTPEQAQRFIAAKELRTVQGKRFESGVNQKMSRRGNSLEGRQVPTNLVPELYFRAGERGAESMGAFNLAAGNNADARSAMRDYAVGRAIEGATKITKDGSTVDLTKLDRWLKTYKPALERLGLRNIAGFAQDIRKDVSRASRAENLAGVKGSPTAQNLATQAIVDRFIGDRRIDANTGTVGSLMASVIKAAPNMMLGKISDVFLKTPNEEVKRILIDAVLDPQLALRLMENAKYVPKTPLSEIMRDQVRAYGATAARLPGLLDGERWK
jgi:hypothetical protein